ncbi:MAG TPA: DUF1295 domain-containing protein [Candidatus Paceibacterota bacterium]
MPEALIHTLECVGLVIWAYMTIWFVIGTTLKRNDVADIAWGVGFIVAALVPLFAYGFEADRSLLTTSLVLIWGSRLAYHIFRRNVKKPEDGRYVAWRNAWGKWVIPRAYGQIFLLQGLLLILVVMPVLVINTYRGGSWTPLDIIGLAVWVVGFFFESQGDRQLRAFIKDPSNKGKILDTGLWRYTRHPNYFGEVTQWWGLGIIALSVPYGWIGLIGPLTITFLILKVSGVPMLERNMEKNPLFDSYRKRTSVFIPMPPKKISDISGDSNQ